MVRIAVGDVMTRKLVSVSPRNSVYDCAKMIAKEGINSILVTNEDKLLGIITSRDILNLITKKPSINLKKIPVMQLATKKVAVIKPSADISQALKKMQLYNFRRLPVISQGVVIGMITLKDILRISPSLYSELGELVQIREESRKLASTVTEWPEEGFCDNCGTFSELLKVENRILCPDCRDELY